MAVVLECVDLKSGRYSILIAPFLLYSRPAMFGLRWIPGRVGADCRKRVPVLLLLWLKCLQPVTVYWRMVLGWDFREVDGYKQSQAERATVCS